MSMDPNKAQSASLCVAYEMSTWAGQYRHKFKPDTMVVAAAIVFAGLLIADSIQSQSRGAE